MPKKITTAYKPTKLLLKLAPGYYLDLSGAFSIDFFAGQTRKAMGLYRYKIASEGGKEIEGKITAKTESDARKNVEKQKSVVAWLFIKEENPAAPKTKSAQLAATPASAKPTPLQLKPRSKLERILYLQSGRCFFCEQLLPIEEASIEHLNPKSKGGASTDDNVVACHASLNQTFGDLDLKRKFEFTLRSAGKFKCPSS